MFVLWAYTINCNMNKQNSSETKGHGTEKLVSTIVNTWAIKDEEKHIYHCYNVKGIESLHHGKIREFRMKMRTPCSTKFLKRITDYKNIHTTHK